MPRLSHSKARLAVAPHIRLVGSSSVQASRLYLGYRRRPILLLPLDWWGK